MNTISWPSKSFLLLFFFFNLTHASQVALTEQQLTNLKELCLKNVHQLYEQTVTTMQAITHHSNYWHHIEKKDSLHEQATHALPVLHAEFTHLATTLGTLHFYKQALLTAQASQELFNYIDHFSQFVRSSINTDDTTIIPTVDFDSAYTHIKHTLDLSQKKFFLSSDKKIEHFKKPVWYIRYKQALIVSAVASLATLAGYLYFKPLIDTTATRYTTNTGLFFDNQVIQPIAQIKKIVVDKRNDLIMSESTYNNIKKQLETIVYDWSKKVEPDISSEERTLKIKKIVEYIDTSNVDKHWHDQFSHAFSKTFWNLYDGKLALLETTSVQLLVHKLHAYKIAMQASRDLQLLLPLAALTPTALTGWACYGIGKKIISTLLPNQNSSAVTHCIKETMITIERIINASNRNNQPLSAQQWGNILFHTEQLKKSIDRSRLVNKKLFLIDITELESLNLNLEQKLRVINRMYRTHAILQA